MRNKTFLIIFLGIVIPIVGLNCLIHFFYYDKFTGDLGQLGQIDFGKEYAISLNKNIDENLYFDDIKSENDFNYLENQYDIITIGDSFSRAKNKGYQNYLAKLTGMKILNLALFEFLEPDQTAIMLLNSGFFDKKKPKYLIVQSVERSFLDRAIALDVNKKNDLEKIYLHYKNKKDFQKKEDPVFHPKKFGFFFRKLFKTKKHKSTSKVSIVDLNKNLFSERGEILYYYTADVKNIAKITPENLELANENYNILAQKCEEKGISLIVLPAADKYSVYQDYIVKRKTPKNIFWDTFPPKNHQYIFINTNKILHDAAEKNIKDIFLLNDTHWSYIGHKLVAEKLSEIILKKEKEALTN